MLCCHKLNASRYEDIAMGTYGKKASIITSVCMFACLVGFVMSYIVLVRREYDLKYSFSSKTFYHTR